jgi:phosphocarrier protein
MQTFNYTITDEIGIHARPAGALAKLAKTFNSEVKITLGEKTAAATKLMAVMGLGVKKASEITVTVEGEDEVAAADAIKAFLSENL